MTFHSAMHGKLRYKIFSVYGTTLPHSDYSCKRSVKKTVFGPDNIFEKKFSYKFPTIDIDTSNYIPLTIGFREKAIETQIDDKLKQLDTLLKNLIQLLFAEKLLFDA